MRVRREAGFLRKERVLRAVVARLRRASEGEDFRVLHYSVQADHLHLIVEASDGASFTRRMTGLSTWLARSVNRVLGRSGAFFADRYHREDLASPRQVRNALVYVLQNHRKHAHVRLGHDVGGLDAYSSAPWFGGFAKDADDAFVEARVDALMLLRLPADTPPPLGPPKTWLAGTGWLKSKGGRISIHEIPRVL